MDKANQAGGDVPVFDTADRLRKALRTSGVGVQEIADYLGVSRNTVGAWINGRVTPGKGMVMLWALRTGAPFEWLWELEKETEAPLIRERSGERQHVPAHDVQRELRPAYALG